MQGGFSELHFFRILAQSDTKCIFVVFLKIFLKSDDQSQFLHIRFTFGILQAFDNVLELSIYWKYTLNLFQVSPTDYHRFIYKCHKCLLGFKRRGMLVNHLAKRHPDIALETVPELNLPILKATKDYFCQYCNKVNIIIVNLKLFF